ncbi:MAG TPA: hypothetical protein VD973_07565 [Symbiobacteriaceae bacterium]|jgi:hypothetical protein|nr:hypothetical protein [Symbiobacteriaceae bacterium]
MTKGKPMIPGIDRGQKQGPAKQGHQAGAGAIDGHKTQRQAPVPVRTPPKKP